MAFLPGYLDLVAFQSTPSKTKLITHMPETSKDNANLINDYLFYTEQIVKEVLREEIQ